MVGRQEVMEFELDRWAPIDHVRKLLATQLPEGVELLEVELADPHHKAQAVEIGYEVLLPAEVNLAQETVSSLLGHKELLVTRQRKGRMKQVDIRPSIIDLSLTERRLYMQLAVSEVGTTRPEEVLLHLGIDTSDLETPVEMVRSVVRLKPTPGAGEKARRRRTRV
jgi:radical SAM-linked protein